MTLPPSRIADADAPEPVGADAPGPKLEMRSVTRRPSGGIADEQAAARRAANRYAIGVRTKRRPDPVAPGPKRLRWNVYDLGVGLMFLALGYYVTSAMWASPSGSTPQPNPTDQAFFEWMLSHAVRVFSHGENPFFTTQLNAPLGVNLMTNTGLLGLAIPFAPLTALFGPSVVFVLITMLGLSGTAFSWYYVLSRHFVKDRAAAFVGGLFAGFAPGMMTHANAHPNLIAQFLLPIILWRALALRESRRPVRDGLILGLLVTYQVFLNEELLFLTALGGTLFVAFYVMFRPAVVKAAWRPTLIGLAVGGGLAVVLLAYPLWYQFYGAQSFSGLPLFLQDVYRLPVVSFVTRPTLTFHTGQAALVDPTANLATGTEQNSFLGWTLVLVVLGIIVTRAYRRVEVRALAILGFLFAWASLGDKVSWRDLSLDKAKANWSIWRFFNDLPLFDSVLPSRLALVLVPVIAVLLALAVKDCLRHLRPAWRRFTDPRPNERHVPLLNGRRVVAALGLLAITAGVVSILPTPVKVYPRASLSQSIPKFFSSGDWRGYVPAGSSVLNAQPYDLDNVAAMSWAISQNLDFSIAGGYFLGPEAAPKDPQHPNTHRGQFGPQYRDTMKVLGSVGSGLWHMTSDIDYWKSRAIVDLKYWHTSVIVLADLDNPHADELRETINQLVGPGLRVDDVWVWDTRWTWTAATPGQ